jgi:alpha-D-ribose 1-methylphosphonate 5-triphosphate synthase subunit PhnI
MAYTAVKGGLEAISAAEALVHDGAGTVPAQGLRLLVDQVMGEGGLYAPQLAALAIEQVEGDPIEASFLLRAYRSTLPRVGYSLPVPATALRVRRRISSAFKEIPGGQVLGRTRDYTQRLLRIDRNRPASDTPAVAANGNGHRIAGPDGLLPHRPEFPKVVDHLRAEGLIAPVPERSDGEPEPFDITREAPRYPAPRSARLQALARGETGFMVGMAYSVMRGFGAGHPTIAELRTGDLPVRIAHPLTGDPVTIGTVAITEVEGVTHSASGVGGSGAAGAGDGDERQHDGFDFGYGVVFGQNERKAIAMAILDLALSIPGNEGPAADEEFVLQHCDALESSGFVEHLKLPHYVTFQSQLDRLRYGRLAKLAASGASGQ